MLVFYFIDLLSYLYLVYLYVTWKRTLPILLFMGPVALFICNTEFKCIMPMRTLFVLLFNQLVLFINSEFICL